MHRSARECLEEYLAGGGSRNVPGAFDSHLEGCERCRREAEEMAAQAQMLRLLGTNEETEPLPGFYARVLETVAARSSMGTWAMFADPGFARRLTYAALTLVIVLGSYLVYSEQGQRYDTSSPARFMAAEPLGRTQVGADPQHDRDTVLVSLASYQE
jgi:predicted anti-sigma-YlaC factor YlaD